MFGAVALVVLASVAVIGARVFLESGTGRDFLRTYPGESALPESAPVGFPAWLAWQHFLNAFFLVLIVKTGWQVRTQRRPPANWTRRNTGAWRTKKAPTRISLTLWGHLFLDVLWLTNGVVFVVLLFTTGQWMRIIPTSWDSIPNAISAALQYVAFQWPTDDGWVNYNSLQLWTYFLTIFIAAPLAAITGVRMSGAWPTGLKRLNRIYPIEVARAVNFPVMFYFVAFVIVHVGLVFLTGALRNLNHMYALRDDTSSWAGFWIFIPSLAIMVGAFFAARPLVFAPIARLTGTVSR